MLAATNTTKLSLCPNTSATDFYNSVAEFRLKLVVAHTNQRTAKMITNFPPCYLMTETNAVSEASDLETLMTIGNMQRIIKIIKYDVLGGI